MEEGMTNTWIALVFWAGLLALAIPYVLYAKHPDQKPVAAISIFILIFSAIAFALYGAIVVILSAFDMAAVLRQPLAAVVFMLVIFLPAILVARWQIRKPPARSPRLR